MADRPILFSTPMIRALLAGAKTQTRLVIKPNGGDGTAENPFQFRPRYLIGDRLWVRETWRAHGWYNDCVEIAYKAQQGLVGWSEQHEQIKYPDGDKNALKYYAPKGPNFWRASIHMPRWASRLTLEVADVRVERLHDISEEDAIAEGVSPLCHPEGRPDLTWVGRPINCKAPSRAYKDLWDTLNAKRGHPWKQNPWVAAYTFRVIKSNIDEVSP